MRTKNWCFQWKNYTEDSLSELKTLYDTKSVVRYMVFTFDVYDDVGILDGFVSFRKRKDEVEVKDFFNHSDEDFTCSPCIFPRLCISDITKEDDFEEFGERP